MLASETNGSNGDVAVIFFKAKTKISDDDQLRLDALLKEDEGTYDVYARRSRIEDVEDYLSILRSNHDELGGCSCHCGHPPCSYCTASIGAYDEAMDGIDAEEELAAKERAKRWPNRFKQTIASMFHR